MITLGITGNMGAGKSTVAAMLRAMLIPVFDADAAVHAAMGLDGAAVAAISHHFPAAVRRDAQNRPYIDRKILSPALDDDEQIQTLEDILHPLVFQAAERFKQDSVRNGEMMVGFDIPLLFETASEDFFDVILCVSADEATRRARVLSRPGMNAARFDQIAARQMPDAEKRSRAHYVLETHHTLAETEQRLRMLVGQIRGKTGPAPA